MSGKNEARGMVSEHEGLCRLVMRRYNWAKGRGLEEADLLQEARISVWEAQKDFDPEKGKFSTLAGIRMRWRAGKQLDRMAYPVRLPRTAQRDARERGQPIQCHVVSEDVAEWGVTENPDEQDPFRQRLQRALDALPQRERWVIEQRHFEERTLDAIGADMGVCRERVRQLETRALRRMREVMK